MSRGKKTIQVKSLLEYANRQLTRTDEYADVGFKSGICTMIEEVLSKSGNYEGYHHLNPENCQFGTLGYFSRKYF
jgi:hypothetical protein